jgi:hypothetical protein
MDMYAEWDDVVLGLVDRDCYYRCTPMELGEHIDTEDDMQSMADLIVDGIEFGGPDIGHDEPIPSEAEAIEMYAERRMWKIRQLMRDQAKNDAQADELTAPLRERIGMVERWRDEQNAAIARQVEFLTRQVEQAALSYPWHKQKSRKMPAGTFGKRSVPEKLDIVDAEACITFAEAHGIPVRVKKEPDAKAIREYYDSTGTPPEGCEIIPGYDKPFVKVEVDT